MACRPALGALPLRALAGRAGDRAATPPAGCRAGSPRGIGMDLSRSFRDGRNTVLRAPVVAGAGADPRAEPQNLRPLPRRAGDLVPQPRRHQYLLRDGWSRPLRDAVSGRTDDRLGRPRCRSLSRRPVRRDVCPLRAGRVGEAGDARPLPRGAIPTLLTPLRCTGDCRGHARAVAARAGCGGDRGERARSARRGAPGRSGRPFQRRGLCGDLCACARSYRSSR